MGNKIIATIKKSEGLSAKLSEPGKLKETEKLHNYLRDNTTADARNRSYANTEVVSGKAVTQDNGKWQGTTKVKGAVARIFSQCKTALHKLVDVTKECKSETDVNACWSCRNFLFLTKVPKTFMSGAEHVKCFKEINTRITTDCNPTSSSRVCRKNFQGANPDISETDDCRKKVGTFVFDYIYNSKLADGSPNNFCDFADNACKQKVKEVMADKNVALMIAGTIFEVFELIILYVTYRAVIVFFSGDGDDDDDDDDDDE